MVMVNCVVARGRRAILILGAAIVIALALGPAGTAFAKAAGPASCMGHEASNLSPPGSSEEFPGGMPELVSFIRDNFPGTPPGSIIRTIARLHEGSHEACDAALGG